MGKIIALSMRALLWLVSTYAGQWVLKILVALGLTLATTQVALPALKSIVQSYTSGLPSYLYQAFGAYGFDVAFTMILSALAAKAVGTMSLRAAQQT